MSKILICTGIYPPQIGGPAQYAKEVATELGRQGHDVKIKTYNFEHKLPPIVRHDFFFWRVLFASLVGKIDFILALDTLSVGWPAVMVAKATRKKILIRTGGDFLWESYVERTGDLVLFKNFYDTCRDKLNFKERMIFNITKWTLQNAGAVIFSTKWQKDIFTRVYNLNENKNFIVENFYGDKKVSDSHASSPEKIFVAGTRQLKWKNIDTLKKAFAVAEREVLDKSGNAEKISLDTQPVTHEKFLEKIKNSYAVILVSLGDISPNMILDAIRLNKPFILTKENGLMDRIKDIGVFCEPENPKDIADKIVWLSNPVNYSEQKKKIENFNFRHSWSEIVKEITDIANKL